jgi:sugar phosphate isomerase/epimerase
MNEDTATPVDLDKLAKIYIKIRDKRADNTRMFNAEDKDLEEQMNVLEEQMLDVCKDMGANSIRTSHGTIIRSVKSRYWTNDWDSLYEVIKEHDAFGVLFKAINQTNMKQFLEDNPDVLPKGLNVESEYNVIVRRSKEK